MMSFQYLALIISFHPFSGLDPDVPDVLSLSLAQLSLCAFLDVQDPLSPTDAEALMSTAELRDSEKNVDLENKETSLNCHKLPQVLFKLRGGTSRAPRGLETRILLCTSASSPSSPSIAAIQPAIAMLHHVATFFCCCGITSQLSATL